MPRRTRKSGSEQFIVDNSDFDWKVIRYLHDCQLSKSIDVAIGFFEISELLALADEQRTVFTIDELSEYLKIPKSILYKARRSAGGWERRSRKTNGPRPCC